MSKNKQTRAQHSRLFPRLCNPRIKKSHPEVFCPCGQLPTENEGNDTHRLAAVNVELERRAWGVFHTECYPTYDFVPVRERLTRESDARRGAVLR